MCRLSASWCFVHRLVNCTSFFITWWLTLKDKSTSCACCLLHVSYNGTLSVMSISILVEIFFFYRKCGSSSLFLSNLLAWQVESSWGPFCQNFWPDVILTFIVYIYCIDIAFINDAYIYMKNYVSKKVETIYILYIGIEWIIGR